MARRKWEGLNRVTLSDNESYHAYENLQKLPLPRQYKSLFKIWRVSNVHFTTHANRVRNMHNSFCHLSYCL